MRILIISNKSPFPPRDGGAVATLGMLRGLVTAGNQVSLIAFNTSKHPFEGNPLETEKREKIRLHLVPLNTDIRISAILGNLLFSALPYHMARFRSTGMKKFLKRHLEENNYDIIQIEGLAMCLYLNTLRKYHQGKVCLRAHNVEHDIWALQARQESNPVKSFYAYLLGKRTRRLETKSLKKTDLLVPISQEDTDQFFQLGFRGPMLTIPAGIDETGTSPQEASEPVVVYIGALDWRPNQDGLRWFIREVWDTVKKEVSDARFIIAGRNAPDYFRKEISGPGIKFIGEIADSHRFLSEGQVQVVPLFSGSGIRIKILEGMSLGKAIVASTTACRGIPATPGRDILLADAPGQFALETVRVLKSSALREELGKNAMEFVRKNFDNLALSAELTRFYRENMV